MKKRILAVVLVTVVLAFAGCGNGLKSAFKDTVAGINGLDRTFHVYNDMGDETFTVTGQNTNIESHEGEGFLTIEVGGERWIHCGQTMIAHEAGIVNIADQFDMPEAGVNHAGDDMSYFSSIKNGLTADIVGLERYIIVRPTDTDKVIAVYKGDSVTVEASSLPQTTKILIDDKRLHLYRCDFDVMTAGLLEQ